MDGFLSNALAGQQTSAQGMTQGTAGNAQTTANVSAELLGELTPGAIFEGEIVSVNGQEVQLQLANGQYMAARLEAQLQLAIGQLLQFQVQSNQNSKIVLKPIYTNPQQIKVQEAALKAANLPLNQKTLLLAAKMIEQGMPIDKKSLTGLYRQLLQHPQATADSLIHLTKLKLPITDANLAQYEQYQNAEHKLVGAMQEVEHEVMKLFDEGLKSSLPQEEAVQQTVPDPDHQNRTNQANDKLDLPITQNQQNMASQEAPRAGQPVSMLLFTKELVQLLTQNGENHTDETVTLPSEAAEASAQSDTAPQQTMTQMTAETPLQGEIQNLSASRSEQSAMQTQQPQTSSQESAEPTLLKGSLLDQLSLELQRIEQLALPEQESHLRSSGFRRLLQGALREQLQEQWTLAPEDTAQKEKLQELYQKILRQSQQLQQIMEDAAKGSELQPKAARNLHDNVEFMNQMNQTFQYVQLPLRFSGQTANGELYIYTNKKHMARKDGELTALLHLDMEHLGQLDIRITLETLHSQVTTKFYLEEDVMELLETHMQQLTDILEKKGYQCRTMLEVRQPQSNIIEVMEEQTAGPHALVNYQSFDIRA